MQALINAIKGHVGAMIAGLGANRVGIVTNVDPARHLARVMIQPEGNQSGWLPVNSHWGILQLPTVGDQVLCASQEHDGEHMHVTGGVFSISIPPPKAPSAPSGGTDQNGNAPTNVAPGTEIMLVNRAGAVVRLLPDGSIYVKGTIHHDGDMHVNGDIYDRHGSLDRLRSHYNAHVHTGVQRGSASTDVAQQQDAE